LLVALVLALRHSLWAARCTKAMVSEPLPAVPTWRSWPVLPGLAGYEVVDLEPYRDSGLTSWRPHAMGDARLAGQGVCAERAASLDSWFGQTFTATTGDDWTIRLRAQPRGNRLIVTGERTRPDGENIEPKPILAFHVEDDGIPQLLLRVLGAPLLVLVMIIAWWRYGWVQGGALKRDAGTRA
jgi:hypothetical protein